MMNGCTVWYSLLANENRGFAVTGSSYQCLSSPPPACPADWRCDVLACAVAGGQELASGVGEGRQREAESTAI